MERLALLLAAEAERRRYNDACMSAPADGWQIAGFSFWDRRSAIERLGVIGGRPSVRSRRRGRC